MPAAAVAPASLAELQIVLSEAQRSRVAAIPVGAGTHLSIGNVPARYDVAISLEAMARIVAIEPADLTVTVEAGLKLADLQARLGEHGQFLPLNPPGAEDATIGGILAANVFGPSRLAFGTARDWLIGLRVVHADGTSAKSGGRVVKNVAGYDMHKLHIGALGSLGVIAEATFKVLPSPAARRTFAITCGGARDACTLAVAAWDRGLALHAAEVLSPAAATAVAGQPAWTLLTEVAGGAAAVERTLRELRVLASDTGARIDEVDGAAWPAWSATFQPRGLALRAGVLPGDVASMIELLDHAVGDRPALISATVAAGVVRVILPHGDPDGAALIDDARASLARVSGTLVVDAAPVALKRQIDVFGPPRADIAIMRRLKEQFDPQGVLSPGRFMGKI
ncbi:MAG: FAD-binding oxidoreductase [Chloroflexi bacterium]|nr:FAD-binding oxidoreductase [Chloroflexota bacterium]